MKVKLCKTCNNKFSPRSPIGVYCSYECRRLAKKIQKTKEKKIRLCPLCKIKPSMDPSTKYCLECNKIRLKEYYKKELERKRINTRRYYKEHKEEAEFKYKRNERFKKYFKQRREKDVNFKIAHRLRTLLYVSLRKYTKNGKIYSSEKYGINFKEIIEHLKPFPREIDKMHIDHIIPLSKFNLSDLNEVKKAFSPDNLQWLSAKENIRKSNKI